MAGQNRGGPGARPLTEAGQPTEDETGRKERESQSGVARAKARRAASNCMTAHLMGAKFAGSGTIPARGVASTAGGCMYARFALGLIQCMHAMAQERRTRPVVRPTAERPLEAAVTRRQPHLLRWQRALRGAHESVRFCTCSVEHNERPPSLPSFVILRRTQTSHLRYKRLTFRIHHNGIWQTNPYNNSCCMTFGKAGITWSSSHHHVRPGVESGAPIAVGHL